MSDDNDHHYPVNSVPPVILALVIAVVVIEAAFEFGARGLVGGPGAVGWRLAALNDYAFSGELFRWMIDNNRWSPDQLIRFVSYPFVHAGFSHALFVAVFLLALGKMVAEIFHPLAVLAVFFGSAIAGALAYALLLDTSTPLIGGFPAVYGLIGSFTFLLWVRLAATGSNRYRAFTMIALLLGIQLIFGLLFGGGQDWVADLAGFVAGFGLSFVVSPGGWRHIVERIRER